MSAEHANGNAVIPGWSERPDPESRDSGLGAEPVIRPRFARTGCHRPGMTGPHNREMPRRRVKHIAAFAAFLVVASAMVAGWIASLGPLPLQQAKEVSTTITDRHGKLLRAYAMADGRWRLPVHARADVDPTYLKLLLAYEDRRFRIHSGVDPLALARATLQLLTRGHIVSGGSTITMQLARLMEPRRQRSFSAKIHQIVRAIEIERQLNKDEILNL